MLCFVFFYLLGGSNRIEGKTQEPIFHSTAYFMGQHIFLASFPIHGKMIIERISEINILTRWLFFTG